MTTIEPRVLEMSRTSRPAKASSPRAAVYLPVSTGRQVAHDLSIPDQKAQTQSWCAARGWPVVAEFIEPSASATDGRKAYLSALIDRVEVDDDVIRIVGRKDVLEQAVLAGGAVPAPGVRSFVRKWRARKDSNL